MILCVTQALFYFSHHIPTNSLVSSLDCPMFPLLYLMSCFPKLSNLPIPAFQKKDTVQSEKFDVAAGSPQAFIKDTYMGSKAILIDIAPQNTDPEQVSNLENLKQQLSQQGFEVETLLGKEATSEKITSELKTLLTSDFEFWLIRSMNFSLKIDKSCPQLSRNHF